METLDEEIEISIKKFGSAIYGNEVRASITEYEELMLKKAKIEDKLIAEAQEKSRQSKYLSVAALVLSTIALVMNLVAVL